MDEQQPIRIAHVIGKMVGGGVETFVMNYYRNVDRTKMQFDFIIDSDSKIVPREEIEKMGGRIIEIPPYQKIFSYIKALKKVLDENKYVIVHSHLNSLSVFPLFAAYLSRVPVRIAHSHSTTNKKEWKKNIIKNILKPFSKIFSTHYFACSEHAAKWLFGEKNVKKQLVKIIPNAIDVDKFKFNTQIRANIREKLKLEDKLLIGHVGRFVEQKNHIFLIDLFNEVYKERKDAVLILIGEGPLEEQIKQRVKYYNLDNVVYFLGIKDNVNELMQAMDVFVFPSLYEGLGIVTIEAQCSNLNVICSEFVPTEVCINDNIKFCKLENIDIWKKNILEMSTERLDCSGKIKSYGYDIKIEAEKFQNHIIELYKERI